MKPIYLDYMATTPLDPVVKAAMLQCYDDPFSFGNSSADHAYGEAAYNAQQTAREQVASLINAHANEIIFIGGATEANNLALFGAAEFYQSKGKHIITTSIEHDAVLEPLKALVKQGFELTVLDVSRDGLVNIADLQRAIRKDTILCSVIHANNEIGVVQPIQEIAQVLHQHGIVFHVDAAQSVGKIPVNVRELGVDLLSMSAHKLYGPKGIGALFVSRHPRVHLTPRMYGGGQEYGLRPGTLATELIVGMGAACAIARNNLFDEQQRLLNYRNHFLKKLDQGLSGWHLNGDSTKRLPGNINITVLDVHSESLVYALRNLALSQAAACSVAKQTVSHVLTALGLSVEAARCSLRISFGRPTTLAEVDAAVELIIQEVTRLRSYLP